MRRSVLAAGVLVLASCARYQALDLPRADDLVRDPTRVEVDAASLRIAAIRTHRFDPSDGFDADELAMLALANNPDLRVARADAGVSTAQAFLAGLLPDPQLSLSQAHTLGHPQGATMAYGVGLSYDLAALVTHPALARARDADTRKADLNLLWLEWQAVSQARTLYLKVGAQERTMAVLRDSQRSFADRYARTRDAAARGLIASDAVTPHLTALQDVNRQVADLERQQNQTRHDLDALVGVAPGVMLVLALSPKPVAVAIPADHDAIVALLARRPDLVALRFGFDAQDDRYRGALLAQFPSFVFGPQRARDTTNVNSIGFSIGVALPVFNRNRGNIAVEKATRAKLRAEYQQRLDASVDAIDRLVTEQALLERQIADARRARDTLARVSDRAVRAFEARDIDALTLTNAQTGLLAKQLETIALEERLAEQRVALQTLAGTDVPTSVVMPTH